MTMRTLNHQKPCPAGLAGYTTNHPASPVRAGRGGGGTRSRQSPKKSILLSGRGIHRTTCKRCGVPVYRGADDDRMAIEVSVDVTPVSYLAEVVAILKGLPTYDLIKGRLYYREPWHYKTPGRNPVHVKHECEGTPK